MSVPLNVVTVTHNVHVSAINMTFSAKNALFGGKTYFYGNGTTFDVTRLLSVCDSVCLVLGVLAYTSGGVIFSWLFLGKNQLKQYVIILCAFVINAV
jgi:hypothetical protein